MLFEQLNLLVIFFEQDMLLVEVEVDVKVDCFVESVFEVVVLGIVIVKVKDKVVFLIEVKQVGIFDICNILDEQFDLFVGIVCLMILFLYLCLNIVDVIMCVGFLLIYFVEINFQVLYEQCFVQFQQQVGVVGVLNGVLNGMMLN